MFDSICWHVSPNKHIACLLQQCMMCFHIPCDHFTNLLVIIDPVTILYFINSCIDFNTVLLAHAIIRPHRETGFNKDPESSDWNAIGIVLT